MLDRIDHRKMGDVGLCDVALVSRHSASHPSRRFGLLKGVASRAGAAGPVYIRLKPNARTALTGGQGTVCLRSARDQSRR